jgi:DNA polymerase I
LDDDSFREMARTYPREVGPMRELRHTLGQLRLTDLEVGPDGRNRVLLSAFRSRTGRNQPSNSKFVFGPSTWLRSLIRPGPGRALTYCDWSQQELGIAAALSEDMRMMDAYRSGDFYLTFAKMAGAVPADATKETHGRERDRFKTVALGVLYGLWADGLARKLGEAPCRGRELLELHRRTFRRFWQWSDAMEADAMLTCRLRTVFGWTLQVGSDANPRSLRNFPMQGNGAEMMRLAACLATERGLTVCAPVHDAFLIEAAADQIEADTAAMQIAMQEASELVLPGFPLKTEAKIVRYPDRFTDPRGERMWRTVMTILANDPAMAVTDGTLPLPPVAPPPCLI